MDIELNQKVEKLANKLFDGDKNPMVALGLDWEKLTSLETEAPEIITSNKTGCNKPES